MTTNPETTTELDTTPTRSRVRPRLARIATLLMLAIAAVAGVTVASPGTADAAGYRNQWVWYDVYTNDRDYELIIYYGPTGAPQMAYADVNNNTVWDAATDLTPSFGAKGWLFNVDERGGWDALHTSDGRTFSSIGGCSSGGGSSNSMVGGGWSYSSQTQDSVYGLWWCTSSSLLTGRISAPNLTGNMLATLSTLSNLAPSMHCYSYQAYYWGGRCNSTPRY
jgi:hypothetical protein